MAPGSVIVDLAAETGGNCELTEAGGDRRSRTASRSSAPPTCRARWPATPRSSTPRTSQNLLELLIDEEGNLKLDFEDEIIAGACLTTDGEIVNERAKEAAEGRRTDGPDHRDHDLRPRRLRRLRGDLEGADDPAHAADVADQRDPRHRHARRADRRSAPPTTRSRR